MEKVRYEVDPHNRLIIKKTGKKTELRRFRRVVEGRFKVDKDNTLTYHIKAPLAEDTKIPHQIKFKGEWALNSNHNLRFTLDKWGRQTFGDQLTLQGDIIDVDKNSLLFALKTRSEKNIQSIYGLKLQGRWQADKHNRLTFRINKERQGYDILTLRRMWDIAKNYQIVYEYEKAKLLTKSKHTHSLAFKGHWDIEDRMRISYVMDKKSNSVFDFKTSLGIFKDKYIKYELGVGLKPRKRTIKLFGKWKIKQNKKLIFEVGGKKKKFQIELSRKILKRDGQAFLRFLKTKRESAILAGAGLGW